MAEEFRFLNSQTPVEERLEWKTDVQVSRNGTETRMPIRLYPRYFYTVTVSLFDPYNNYRSVLDMLLEHNGAEYLFPLYCHAVPVGNGTVFPAIARGPMGCTRVQSEGLVSGELSFFESWLDPVTEGDIWMPAGVGRLNSQYAIQNLTNNFAETLVTFELDNYGATAIEPLYSPVPLEPVFNFRVDWSNSPTNEINHEYLTRDNGILDKISHKHMTNIITLDVALYTEAERIEFRKFLMYCKGRYNTFRFKGPQDVLPAIYRLDSDIITITYTCGALTQCQLRLKRLGD